MECLSNTNKRQINEILQYTRYARAQNTIDKITHFQQFFGLMNSPATFQAMMNHIFSQELIQRWLKIYMDDLLICGRKSDLPELIAHAQKILQICQENDLFVKPDKCDFFVTTVEFLGFMIQEGKLEMNPANSMDLHIGLPWKM